MTHDPEKQKLRMLEDYRDLQCRIATLQSAINRRAKQMKQLGDWLLTDDKNFEMVEVKADGYQLSRRQPVIPFTFAEGLREDMAELTEAKEQNARLWECLDKAGLASILRR